MATIKFGSLSAVYLNGKNCENVFFNNKPAFEAYKDAISAPPLLTFNRLEKQFINAGTATVTLGDDAAANSALISNAISSFPVYSSESSDLYTIIINSNNKSISSIITDNNGINLKLVINGMLNILENTSSIITCTLSHTTYFSIYGKITKNLKSDDKGTTQYVICMAKTFFDSKLELNLIKSSAQSSESNIQIAQPVFCSTPSEMIIKIDFLNQSHDMNCTIIPARDCYYNNFEIDATGFLNKAGFNNWLNIIFNEISASGSIIYENFNLKIPERIIINSNLTNGAIIFKNLVSSNAIVFRRDAAVEQARENKPVNFNNYISVNKSGANMLEFEAILKGTTNQYIPVKMKNLVITEDLA